MDVPLPDESVDAVVSQEALLHVPDKRRALAEAYRILKPGGRLAFTDWTPDAPLSAADADLLWRGMAARSLQSVAGYHTLLADVGFRVVAVDDEDMILRVDTHSNHVAQNPMVGQRLGPERIDLEPRRLDAAGGRRRAPFEPERAEPQGEEQGYQCRGDRDLAFHIGGL